MTEYVTLVIFFLLFIPVCLSVPGLDYYWPGHGMEGKGDTVIPSLSEASNRTGPAPSTNSHQSAPHRACCDFSDKCEMNDVNNGPHQELSRHMEEG